MPEPGDQQRLHDRDRPVYIISIAAELTGLHPQTLRAYDRLGLVRPGRAPGQGRRYSDADIEQLRQVQALSQEAGVNLAGVKHILQLYEQIAALRAQVAELQRQLAVARQLVDDTQAEPGGAARQPGPRGAAAQPHKGFGGPGGAAGAA